MGVLFRSVYYGKTIFDMAGSMAHESFIYNAARGRLDVYTFDLWNLNQCQCAYPQPGMDMCKQGFYRWSINAFAYLPNATRQHSKYVPKFDEPFISMEWPLELAPHRAAVICDCEAVWLVRWLCVRDKGRARGFCLEDGAADRRRW